MSFKNKKLYFLIIALLLIISAVCFFNTKYSSASNQEIINLIRQAETMIQRITIPPSEYIGNIKDLPESAKKQMLEQNLKDIDNLFGGNAHSSMINVVNYHFSRPISRNCVDGGVSKINIIRLNYTETGAEVTADVYKYLVHRENRNGQLVDVRLDGKGTYIYTLEKTADGWKITNIDGGPDLDSSRTRIIPVK